MPKIIKPIVVQPGTAQLEVYKLYINNPPYAGRANPRRALELRNRIGMQLNILRQAALCPESENLAQVILGAGVEGMRKSWTDANPKQAAVLALIADLVARGEQVIVGSPFRCFSQHLTGRPRQAFVRCVMLDGTVSPERRGEMAADFKAGRYSVLVAGQNAMGEGNSFECAAHLILPSLSWAFDENAQFLDRIWRLNSPKPVTIYTMTTAGTIDEKMDALFGEKGDSSQLALDGRLVEEAIEEVDLAALLAGAVRDFKPFASTVDEQDIEAAWPALRHRLTLAERRFREIRGATTLEARKVADDPAKRIRAAMAKLRAMAR